MYKTICMDLDGTLLNSKKEIGTKSKEIILKLKKSYKVRIVLASGRHFNEIEPFIRTLGLDNNDYIISCDGMYVHCVNSEILWLNDYLNYADLQFLYKFVARQDMLVVTDKGDIHLFSSLKKWIKNKIHKQNRKTKSSLHLFGIDEECKIEKICIDDILEIPHKINNDRIKCVHNKQENKYDIYHCNVNKYVALSFLLKKIQVNEDEVLYFGDSINDIECFSHLQNTIAVANAIPEIRNLAWKIVGSCDDDGVGNTLEELFIINE